MREKPTLFVATVTTAGHGSTPLGAFQEALRGAGIDYQKVRAELA